MSLVVDLETGEWKQIGELNDGFAPIGWNDWSMRLGFGEHSLLKVLPKGSEAPSEIFYIDGATGEVFPRAHTDGAYAEILSRSREAARRRSPFRMPDGRRVWGLHGNLEMETEAGGIEELPWDHRDEAIGVRGYGLGVFSLGFLVTYDFTRHRLIDEPRFLPGCCWVLESHWLVGDRERTLKPPTLGRHFSNWRLLDPETGEENVAMGMIDGDRVTAVLDDGRVLIKHESDGGDTAMLTVDLRTGRREPLTLDGFAVTRSVSERHPMRTPDGRRLFYISLPNSPRGLTSLASGSNTLTPPIPMSEVIGCPDVTTALIISANRRRIERVDLLTGEREILFPR